MKISILTTFILILLLGVSNITLAENKGLVNDVEGLKLKVQELEKKLDDLVNNNDPNTSKECKIHNSFVCSEGCIYRNAKTELFELGNSKLHLTDKEIKTLNKNIVAKNKIIEAGFVRVNFNLKLKVKYSAKYSNKKLETIAAFKEEQKEGVLLKYNLESLEKGRIIKDKIITRYDVLGPVFDDQKDFSDIDKHIDPIELLSNDLNGFYKLSFFSECYKVVSFGSIREHSFWSEWEFYDDKRLIHKIQIKSPDGKTNKEHVLYLRYTPVEGRP